MPTDKKNQPDYLKLALLGLVRTEVGAVVERITRVVRAARDELALAIDTRLSRIEEVMNARMAALKDGYTPVKGVDYVDGAPGSPGYTPQKGVDYFDGADADEEAMVARILETLTPSALDTIEKRLPQLGHAVRDALELLQEDDRIDAKSIRGLEEHVTGIIAKQPYSMGGGAVVSIQSAGVNKVNQAGTLNFTGPGAPTVSLGTNGVTNIAFPSSSGGITELAATGTIDSANTSFTFVSKPTYLVIDGVKYKQNAGWTWNSGTLTATTTKAPDYSIWGEA